MPVRNTIKNFVDGMGISVYAFRKRAGIAQRTAYSLYNSPLQIPASTVLSKICDAFEVDPGAILDWVPPTNSSTRN